MKTTRLTQCVATWMALFAVLMAVLAPSISHAISLAKDAPNGWVEICTVSGSKVVAVEVDQTPDLPEPAKQGTHVEHCAYCLQHGGTTGLLPSVVFVMPVLSGEHILHPLYSQASSPLFAWSIASPRAPPKNF